MTIYNIGSNYYLGNVKFGTFNVSYPSIPYLEAFPHNAISAEISALCTAAGLPFRNVLPQATFDAYTSARSFLTFGSQGDIDDRYVFDVPRYDVFNDASGASKIYNNSGYTGTTNLVNTTNQLVTANSGAYAIGGDITNIDTTASSFQWAGVANNKELALLINQHLFNTNQNRFMFWYAGIMDAVTTDFNYYSANVLSKSVCILCTKGVSLNQTPAKHYISNAQKDILRTGFAEYPTEGSTTQWAKGLGFFDNNTTLGFPTMGKSNILRVLEGTYTIGKPANIVGDVANRKWLPLGSWTPNRTLAMAVYSA